MAKRIIVNGLYTKCTCSKCQCQFSFDPKVDLEENGNVTCPECATENTPKKQ